MSAIILFGLPGVGKTYVGKVLAQHFGFHFFEGDQELPAGMKSVLAANGKVTDAMRDEFFGRLVAKVEQLQKRHEKLAVAQTFIKDKYRRQLLTAIPDAQFVLITADDQKREKRVLKRGDYPLVYIHKMDAMFEPPRNVFQTIENTPDGSAHIMTQLRKWFE